MTTPVTEPTSSENTQNILYGKDPVESDPATENVDANKNPKELVPPEAKMEGKSEDDKTVVEVSTKAEGTTEEVKYDLTLSEGSLLSTDQLQKVELFAKENKLTVEQAKTLLQQQEQTLNSFWDKQMEIVEKEKDTWRQEIIQDPQLGGEHLNKHAEMAKRVVKTFGSDKFVELLRDTGYGDHPEVFKFLVKLGRQMADDSLILPGVGAKTPKTAVELFYGS